MDSLKYTMEQQAIIQGDSGRRTFLEGPAGCGKTTTGVGRMLELIHSGVPADSILVLTPQRTLASPYFQAVQSQAFPAGSLPDILTPNGLAQRAIDLFWPAVAPLAGFAHPDQPPTFLTLETAQYYLGQIADPYLAHGYFENLAIDRSRLFSQLLDNLNKAALIGFDPATVAERLKSAYQGKTASPRIFDDAQEIALHFRRYCLANNLLDFSLQVEIFVHTLWPSVECRLYLNNRYHHLIYDNLEEDAPVFHDLMEDWLPQLGSALLIYDEDGGYRTFLGADPQSADHLKDGCETVHTMSHSWIISPQVECLRQSMLCAMRYQVPEDPIDLDGSAQFCYDRYFPQTIDRVCKEIQRLVFEEGLPPREIVVIAPFMTDSLRFSLMDRLAGLQIPARSHRPSRSLAKEPATRCLLTWAQFAHPEWGFTCSREDLRYALMLSITGADLVRSDLISRILYSENRPEQGLGSFDRIQPEMQERISYAIGEQYETLRGWILNYCAENAAEPVTLDTFISKLFGEVLSQPGFGFHQNFDSAALAAQLVESVQKFRRATGEPFQQDPALSGKEYIRMLESGLLAAQSLPAWNDSADDAVLVAPAHTFLMSNRPVSVQFWLDVGSSGWWERLNQPLTHPHVLSRRWLPGAVWTDADDQRANQQALSRLITGLLRRCRERAILCATGVSEQGDEQRGPLLKCIQNLLKQQPLGLEVSIV